MAFDGEHIRVRSMTGGGVAAPSISSGPDGHTVAQSVQVYGEIDPSDTLPFTFAPDPIYSAYKVNWINIDRKPEQLWVSQALRRKTPKISNTKNGNLLFEWRYLEAGLERIISSELDPSRGYMITRSDYASQYRTPRRDAVVWVRYRILNPESQDMNGWHMPTHTVQESLDRNGKVAYRTEIRLSNLQTDFSDSIFTNVFQPGDIVRAGSTHFQVLQDGSLKEFRLTSWEEQSAKQTQRDYIVAVGSICGAIAAAFLVVTGVKRARTKKRL